jgi:hypothetical protein
MGKKYKILHTNMSLCSEGMENNLVLVFMNDSVVEATFIIPFPKWFIYYDPDYQYYQICFN